MNNRTHERDQPAATVALGQAAAITQDTSPFQVLRRYTSRIPADFVPFPEPALDGSIVERFEAQVAQHGAAIAFHTDTHRLTYDELNAAANQIAHAILIHAAPQTQVVVIVMSLDDCFLPALVGVLKAGKGYVFVEADEPAAQITEKLAMTEVDTVLTSEKYVGQITPCLSSGHKLWIVEELATTPGQDNPGLRIRPDQLLGVFFTSGSTGKPKGVMRLQRQMLHAAWLNTNANYVSPSDCVALSFSPSFAGSIASILDSIMNGATLCPINVRRRSGRALWNLLQQRKISLFLCPIPKMRELMDVDGTTPWPELRIVRLGAQSLYGGDVAAFQRCFGPDVVLQFVYSATETTTVCTAYIDHTLVPSKARVPVGYPVGDKVVYVMDEQGNRLGHNQVGQLVVSSAYHSPGYWRDAKLDAGKFCPDPAGQGRRLLFTGDQCLIRDDGCIEFYGRADDMIKVHGYRVEPSAIEARLRLHPAVHDVVVVGRPTADNDVQLVAYCAPQQTAMSHHELRTFIGTTLPSYMIPARFVYLDKLPMTINGKVDRRALPPPGRSRPVLSTAYVAPKRDAELALAQRWAEILDIEQIGLDDSLIELGATSLQLARGLLDHQTDTGDDAAIARWLQAPTLRNLLNPAGIAPVAQAPRRAPQPTTQHMPQHIRHQRLLRLSLRGPIVQKVALPYALGVRLQRVWVRLPWVRMALDDRFRERFQQALALTGKSDPKGHLYETHLLANTWIAWRNRMLDHATVQARWVTVVGTAHIDAIWRAGRPLVVAILHGALPNRVALHYVEKRFPYYRFVAGSGLPQSARIVQNTEQAKDTLQILARQGAITVAADGLKSSIHTYLPFHGRYMALAEGPIQFATYGDAELVPLLTSLAPDGKITQEFFPPLTQTLPSSGPRDEELAKAYVGFLAQRWPSILPQMRSDVLPRFMLTGPDDPAGTLAYYYNVLQFPRRTHLTAAEEPMLD